MAARFEAPFVLALDVGSSSVKGALYDARARLVEGTLVREPGVLRIGRDGAAEADPEDLARRAEAVLDGVLARPSARGRKVAAVGLDTMVFTVAGVDAAGRLLTPLYTYADTRPREDVLALAGELDRSETYQRTGCPLHTGYLPARLRWLRRVEPALSARVRLWLDVGTWLYTRWFAAGNVAMSYSTASWSGLLDRHRLRWDEELLRHLGVDEGALPPLAEYGAAQRSLAPRFARRWGALRDVPFFLGVGDGAAANVGSGCVSPRRTALTVGTSGAMRILLPGQSPAVPPGLWAYKLGSADTLLGGALTTGGRRWPGRAASCACLRRRSSTARSPGCARTGMASPCCRSWPASAARDGRRTRARSSTAWAAPPPRCRSCRPAWRRYRIDSRWWPGCSRRTRRRRTRSWPAAAP